MIIDIQPSTMKYKRYVVTMDNGKKYNFGLKGGTTFIETGDVLLRENYRKRHYANKTERTLIDNLIPSPSLFSYYILWGKTTDIRENIKYLNNLWRKKDK
jgi:hypothetical protein